MITCTSRRYLLRICSPSYLPVPSRACMAALRVGGKHQSHKITVLSHRQFSQSVYYSYPRKDSQHKDSINTEASEYSKSATDDEGARQQDAAFDPSITDPQEQKDKAGEGTGEGTVSHQVLLSSLCIINAVWPTSPVARAISNRQS